MRVGTRGSRLSLAQTDLIVARLKETVSDVNIEKKIITTSGDTDLKTPLYSLNQKGIFEKEIDQAVLEGRIDFAVHSLKDIPVLEEPTELVIAGIPERGSPVDALVASNGRKLEDLRPGSIVGTSSLLRASQLKRVRPDVRPKPIRGNVDTRVQKVDRGEYDAVILAEAGLARLGLTGRITERLSLEDFLPAPGQGTLATVARRDNYAMIELLSRIEHRPTRDEAEAERELVRILEGGCKVPIGALAVSTDDAIRLTACVLSVDGKQRLDSTQTGQEKNLIGLAQKVAKELLLRGARRLELEWREAYPEIAAQ